MEALINPSLEIIDKLENLYPQLASTVPEASTPSLSLPPLAELTQRVSESSFRVFPDPGSYLSSERAKSYPNWSASSRNTEALQGSEVYRIFFNDYSRKIYVDLNGARWSEIRQNLQEENLYCEILRTLIFVLTCEVNPVEDSVTGGATEIIP